MNDFTFKGIEYNYITFEEKVKHIFTASMPPSLVTDDDVRMAAKEDLKMKLITEGARHD